MKTIHKYGKLTTLLAEARKINQSDKTTMKKKTNGSKIINNGRTPDSTTWFLPTV